MTTGMEKLGEMFKSIQAWLIPPLEDELGVLDQKHKFFIAVCKICALQQHLTSYQWIGNGCPPKSRLALCKAFIAKALWNFTTTSALIDSIRHRPTLRRLCGWETIGEIPSESTFSRAFAVFAQDTLPQHIHETTIKQCYGEKLAGHVSRDATAINAREKAASKPPKEEKKPKKRGRPSKNEPPRKPDLTRIQRQLERRFEENIADLPTDCNWGSKKNSKGKTQQWRGYKYHLDVIDGDIPVSAILTSASLHDSQVYIPLAQMTARRITNLYDLADAAYDAGALHEMSNRLGHVALIDHNPRRGEKRQFAPAQAIRYRERSAAERVNSHLKDAHGGCHIRVRGALKIAAHLGFGILVIAVEQLLKLLE